MTDFDYSRFDSLPKLQRYRCLGVLHNEDQFRNLQTEQLLSQMGLGQVRNNPYEWNDFKAIAEQTLVRNGIPYKDNEGRQQVFSRAMTTADFKNLLADVANKLLSNRMDQYPCHLSRMDKTSRGQELQRYFAHFVLFVLETHEDRRGARDHSRWFRHRIRIVQVGDLRQDILDIQTRLCERRIRSNQERPALDGCFGETDR